MWILDTLFLKKLAKYEYQTYTMLFLDDPLHHKMDFDNILSIQSKLGLV